MPKTQKSNVDAWLKRETDQKRKALESASRYFDSNDNLTVNTLEAIYGRESSFGTMLGERGSTDAAGHFQLKADTARQYGLNISKSNDQRFDIDYASSVAARYLKDLDSMFRKETTLVGELKTILVKDISERKKFALGAYNVGQGHTAIAQRLAKEAGKNPQLWSDVEKFLELAGAAKTAARDAREYLKNIPFYESQFAIKSPANKKMKQKEPKKGKYWCTDGHWVTIEDRPVFICD